MLAGVTALGAVGAAACRPFSEAGGADAAASPGATATGITTGPGALDSATAAPGSQPSSSPQPLTRRVVGAEDGDIGASVPDSSSNGAAAAQQQAAQESGTDSAGNPPSTGDGGSAAQSAGAEPTADASGSSQPSGSASADPSGSADPSASSQSSAGSEPSAGGGQSTRPDVYSHTPEQATVTATSDLAPGITLKTSPAWHLARRASDAATAEIAADIESMGAEAWIDDQLAPERIDDSRAEDIISSYFPWSEMTTPELAGPTNREVYRGAATVTNAILARWRFSNRVLAESIVEMMADHVYVPLRGKGESFVTGFDVILRKHALGRYADLLYAALTNVALLEELDNVESTKDSPNENLGRELLELYTVGRDTYTEDDVKGSTRLLTGHGKDWETLSYVYRPEQHATGAVDVLGFHDDNTDAAKGPELLRRYVEYLCTHEATAKRLATRIARRFIEDQPSQAVVDHIAHAYLDNDTRIGPAVRAALTHPDFQAAVGKKWRRPMELIMTIARAAHVESVKPRGRVDGGDTNNTGVYGWLVQAAGHEPRMYATVDGYPDTAEYWMSTSRLMNLWNACQNAVIGDKEESGRTDWAKVLYVGAGANAMETAARISWHLTGYAWPDAHLEPVAAVLAGTPSQGGAAEWTVTDNGTANCVAQAVRLCFASPYGFLR